MTCKLGNLWLYHGLLDLVRGDCENTAEYEYTLGSINAELDLLQLAHVAFQRDYPSHGRSDNHHERVKPIAHHATKAHYHAIT